MTAFADMIHDIRPLIPRATVMAIQRAARQTARHFFRETRALTTEIGAGDYTFAADNRTATLTLPADTELYAIVDLKCGSAQVHHSTARDMALGNPLRGISAEVRYPNILYFSSETSGPLEGTVALLPTRDATTLDDNAFGQYYDGLLAGTKASLYLMKGFEWFDADLAQIEGGIYQIELERANGRSIHQPSLTAYGGIR